MADVVRTLVVKAPSGEERVVPVDQDTITIGRDPSCTIRLDSPYVSRQHARLEARETGLVLVDLGSHNGSLLNGVRVEGSARLSVGDVVAIADTTIQCLGDEAPAESTRTLVQAAGQPAPSDLLRMNAQTYEVWIGDTRLERRLSTQEFHLLRYLYEHRDRVCVRRELGDAIWGAHNWDPNMLHRLVHRLKEKLEPIAEQPRYVQTVPGIGYRITP